MSALPGYFRHQLVPISLVVLAIFRTVSLGSILAALAAIVLIRGLEQPMPYRMLVIAGSVYVVVRHRANIRRLLARTKPRLGRIGLTKQKLKKQVNILQS